MDSENEKIVFKIRSEYRDLRIEKSQIKNKYEDFVEKFPQLFDMICSDNCDDNILNKMLSIRRAVSNGSISQHDGSVQVGQDLVNKYVKPVVKTDE